MPITGFFGLEFGAPVPLDVVVDKKDPKFESALLNLNGAERALARGDWLQALFVLTVLVDAGTQGCGFKGHFFT